MGDCPVTWSIGIYSIRLGSQAYGSFFEEFPVSHGDRVDDKHWFSSPDGRLVGEDHPDFRGHATGIRS